jgi:hypothetical protein
LKDKSPRDQGEKEEQTQDGTRNPAGLRKNVKDVANKAGEEQKNNVSPSVEREFCWQIYRNTGREQGSKK